jgi:hypothetical protein
MQVKVIDLGFSCFITDHLSGSSLLSVPFRPVNNLLNLLRLMQCRCEVKVIDLGFSCFVTDHLSAHCSTSRLNCTALSACCAGVRSR